MRTVLFDEVRDRLGQRLYRAGGYWWDGDDLHEVASGDYRTVPAAKLAARSWLAKGATLFDIRRGSYVETRIHDDAYGVVLDADWAEDDGLDHPRLGRRREPHRVGAGDVVSDAQAISLCAPDGDKREAVR